MSRFRNKSNQEVLHEGTDAWMAAHEAKQAGNYGEANRQRARYDETEQEMARRYQAENTDPEAALLLRRALGDNY